MASNNILSMITEEDVIKTVINTSAGRTTSALHDAMCNHVGGMMKESIDIVKKKKKIDVRRALTAEQVQLLNDLYPERHVVTTSVERGTHSMAAAIRKLELEIILDSIPENAWVYDIGGNWATHSKRSSKENGQVMLRNVHCCCPILDYRDAQRKANRWSAVNNFVSEQKVISVETGQRLREISEDNERIAYALKNGDNSYEAMNGRWFCQNRFEDCVFEHDGEAYAIAIHSIYDIELEDLVDGLERKRIKYFKGTFLFSIDILLGRKNGTLPTVDGFFEVEGDRLTYSFFNDPNCSYTHSLRRLNQYLRKTYIRAAGGSVYYLELTELRGDVMFFSLVDASEAVRMGVKVDESRKFLPVDGRDKVVFPLFTNDSFSDELTLTETILPKDFVNKCVEYVIRSKENQLSCDNIVNFLASTNNSIVINGSARRTTQKVDSKLIVPIATTLLVYAEMQKSTQKSIVSKLRTYVKEQLNFGDLLKVSWKRIFGRRSIYQKAVQMFASWLKIANGPRILEFSDMPLYFEVKDRIDLWFKYSSDIDYKIDFKLLEKKVLNYVETKHETLLVTNNLMKDKFGITMENPTLPRTSRERRKTYYTGAVPPGFVDSGVLQRWIDGDHFGNTARVDDDAPIWFKNLMKNIKEFFVPDFQFTPVYDEIDEDSVEEIPEANVNETVIDIGENSDLVEDDPVSRANSLDRVSIETAIGKKPETEEDLTSPVHTNESDRVSLAGIRKSIFEAGSASGKNLEMVVATESDGQEIVDDISEICSEPGREDVFETEIMPSSHAESEVVGRFNLPESPLLKDTNSFSHNAKLEFLWYLQCKMISDKSAMYDIVDDYVKGMYHTGNCQFPKDAKFYNIEKRRWLFNRPENKREYKYGVNFGISDDPDCEELILYCNLVELQWDCTNTNHIKLVSGSLKGYIMICDLTFLMNERIIYKNCWHVYKKTKPRSEMRVTLIDGVPGCGKSTWILDNANLSNEYVLSMGRKATDDLIERFKNVRKISDQKQLSKIKTVDSFLMHFKKGDKANRFHFDEALMAHAGTVYFCGTILGARRVICQGDSKQIPFINRVESINLKYAALKIDTIETKRTTYRSPVDVAYYLTKKNYYGNDIIKSTNGICQSMKVVGPRDKNGMTSKYSIPKIHGAQYLTFTQSEKEEMLQYLGREGVWSVNTVHEAQGKTYDDVILVRLKETANEIYPGGRNSEPYTVVATTRHRRSLVYYTKAEDVLYSDITEMMQVMEEKLCKHLISENTK